MIFLFIINDLRYTIHIAIHFFHVIHKRFKRFKEYGQFRIRNRLQRFLIIIIVAGIN